MLTEKYENEIIKSVTNRLLEKNKLSKELHAISDIKDFFDTLSENMRDNDDLASQYIAFFLYHKISEKDVRLRKVTSRTFEEFIGNIYGLSPTDNSNKSNPGVDEKIQELSDLYVEKAKKDDKFKKLMTDKDGKIWTIAADLSGNRREKADLLNDDVEVSIKTLKGWIQEDTKANTEINIGSLSYRSLFLGIHDEEKLGDRKGGLGSGKQMLELLEKVKKNGKLNEFISRLELFLTYLYSNDNFLVAFKSDLKIQFFFFPGKELVDLLISLLNKDIEDFTKIFYRWENNNLRIQVGELLNNRKTKLWKAKSIDDIIDYPEYEGFPNPFSKKNMIILNLEHALKNEKLNKIIESQNSSYVESLLTHILG